MDESSKQDPTVTRPRRGFATMDPARQREIASLGGRAAHARGHAHKFTPDEASAAGRKRHEKAKAQGEAKTNERS